MELVSSFINLYYGTDQYIPDRIMLPLKSRAGPASRNC